MTANVGTIRSKGERMEKQASDDGVVTIGYEVTDRVAMVTLQRPESLNALTFEMEELLVSRLADADADPGVGCVVVTGAGRGFCAGDDVKAMWDNTQMADSLAGLATPRAAVTPLFEVMLGMLTPTVAAVNGPAIGIGMDLALLCDIRIASPQARFSQRYAAMGLVADLAGVWLLPQLVGRSAAAELLLTADIVDADRAADLGLVSRLVGADDLLPEAVQLARRIAAMPSLAVEATKELLRRSVGRPASDVGDLGALRGVRLHALFQTADHQEAVRAYAERRSPRFEGR